MNLYRKLISIGLLSSISTLGMAAKLDFCVVDLMGANGDVMAVAKDYALVAKQWGVDVTPIVYTNLNAAIRDFDSQKCQGIAADNYATKKYNHFLGTIGAVGAIPNYDIAQKVLMALSSSRLISKMKNKDYEVVGYMPYGMAYFHTKDRSLNSINGLQNKRLGILEVDNSQRRMAQKVGMQPINSTLDNIIGKFKNNEIDILPAPLVIYKPLEIGKMLGDQGGIINYPLALFTMNFIVATGNYPADFGQKSRQWFSQKSPQFIKTVERWDSTVPKNIIYDIPAIDAASYDRLLSQLRKEFIESQIYDNTMIALIKHLRCAQEPKFIECKP